jgi:hypothetical protein
MVLACGEDEPLGLTSESRDCADRDGTVQATFAVPADALVEATVCSGDRCSGASYWRAGDTVTVDCFDEVDLVAEVRVVH